MSVERLPGDAISAPQLAAILRLRAEVFVVEQAICCNDLVPAIDCLDTTVQYAVFGPDGEALATSRTYPHEGARKVGRVATALSVRGTGMGLRIMEAVIAAEPGRLVLSGQVAAAGFYERLGFVRVGGIYLEDGIDHVWMERPDH